MKTREDVQSRHLFCKLQFCMETTSIEINLKERRWFLNGSYNPYRNSISNHLSSLNFLIDEYTETYDNIYSIRDFYIFMEDTSMNLNGSCNLNGSTSLINVSTCLKNFSKPPTIDYHSVF